MIPLRSEQRLRVVPLATVFIAALCAAVMFRLASLEADRAGSIVTALALVPSRLFAAPLSPGQLVTTVSSTFLHAGWLHLIGNLVFLAAFGPAVEARLGWRRFLLLYLACGAAGALAHALMDPASTRPLVGASGAIAGVLGAHLVLAPRDKITTLVPVGFFFEVASLPAAFVIGLWFLLQLASGVAPVVPGSESASIAWYAHLAGFAAGLVLALPMARSAPKRKQVAAKRGRTGRSSGKRAA